MSEPFDASAVDIPNLFKWVIACPDDGVLDLGSLEGLGGGGQAIVNHSEIASVIMRDGSPVGAVTGSMSDLPSEMFQEVPDYIGGGLALKGLPSQFTRTTEKRV